ncbi:hypothetical protein AGMMS49957_04740 [Synergistales bacterium]|nr:hypothetical protein AGMMS49957_04740 [Synergistales bacterium]
MTPAREMMMEITIANRGREMKNSENMFHLFLLTQRLLKGKLPDADMRFSTTVSNIYCSDAL